MLREPQARDIAAGQAGYGTDPDLIKEWRPGGPWPLTLGDRRATNYHGALRPDHSRGRRFTRRLFRRRRGFHRRMDQRSVSAATRRIATSFFPACSGSKRKRRTASASHLPVSRKNSVRPLPTPSAVQPRRRRKLATAAKFFARFRDLTAGGFYTTPVGMKDIGYVGNVPLERFDGPPPELLRKLGLA